MVPQVRRSAGKSKGKNATGQGNPYIGAAIGEIVIGASRAQTDLGPDYYETRADTRRRPQTRPLVTRRREPPHAWLRSYFLTSPIARLVSQVMRSQAVKG